MSRCPHWSEETMANAEQDVLACMSFPAARRAKLHPASPIERHNGGIKRRTEVVGIFPKEHAIARLIGAILTEQSEDRAVRRARCMTLETMAPVSIRQEIGPPDPFLLMLTPTVMPPAVPGAGPARTSPGSW